MLSDLFASHLPSLAAALHLIGQLDVFAVHVELPLSLAENPGEYCTRVNTDPHVDRTIGRLLDVLDCLDHGQAHVDAQYRVIRTLLWCATYAVVTVAQDFYP